SDVLAAIATLAPSRAARNAIASPMPRLPPETNSVLPLSDVMFPPCGRFLALLSRGLRTTGTRIGRAEQRIVSHGDRIGRGIAERLDHVMALGLQLRQHVVGEAALGPHLIRQPLMVQARLRDRG